ncbi:undecaprenyl-phosphate glucose phosphotransferase [Ferruginivarius sediminum]|nr:undecaprenyl-phosphate glucose phosphotransferase [Ferruginivarius sediminum]
MSDHGKVADIGEPLTALDGRSTRIGTRWSPGVVVGVVRAVDLAILVATGVLAYLARFGSVSLGHDELIAVVLIGPVAANVFQAAGVYGAEALSDSPTQARKSVLAWTATMLIVVLLGYITKTSEQYSRLWAGLWFLLGGFGLLAFRAVLAALLNRAGARGALTQRVALLTSPGLLSDARRLAGHLADNAQPGVELAGIFTVAGTDAGGTEPNVAGDARALLRKAEANGVDRVIAVLPWSDMDALHETLEPLRAVNVDVDLAPPALDERLMGRPVRQTLGVPAINLMTRPLSGWDVVLKRAEDYLIGTVALLSASPLMLLIALAIKLESRGPVFFRQPRHGFNNNLFRVYKFRTMYQTQQDLAAERLTVPGDPRVTKVGVVLRRTSLDELPQLLNVLKGEMSIVGPRPHAISAKAGGIPYREAVKEYAHRHRVLPGITGWAQVNGWRGDTDIVEKIEKRVEHDLYYIDNWSLWLDLRIIAITLLKLSHRNAY